MGTALLLPRDVASADGPMLTIALMFQQRMRKLPH